jgi:uncharacterized protein
LATIGQIRIATEFFIGRIKIAIQSPTKKSNRYELIDIVRGFALFGVLLANMIWVTQWFATTEAQRAAMPTPNLDVAASYMTFMLVDFKFYTLFAMLFGLGFAMQFTRSQAVGRQILPIYMRRLSILFVFGLFHAYFLWFGDILHIYAFVGFFLILFRNLSDRAILRWAICLALVSALMPLAGSISVSLPWASNSIESMSTDERFSALTSGYMTDVFRVNADFMRTEYAGLKFGFDTSLYWFVSVLWKFLVGFVIGRKMLLQNSSEHLSGFRRILPWVLLIGIAGNLYLATATWFFDATIPNSDTLADSLIWVAVEIGLFAFSVAYLAGLVISYQNPACRKGLAYLAPVGQMALTNYLLQSVVTVVLFYGVGFSLLGKVGASAIVAISFAVFGAQIFLSRWWLARYRFGPMEWLWRCLTYGRIQPFRVSSAAGE